MEVTAERVARIPLGNLRVPRAAFAAVWTVAEQRNAAGDQVDWYAGGVGATCRWLAVAVMEGQPGGRALPPAPATRHRTPAYEELIEAEYIAAEQLGRHRPELVVDRPGWCEGIQATLRWTWRGEGPAPFDVQPTRPPAGSHGVHR
ncbi:hypothetical protein [Pseudonocardia thermophila]|jgi:hypothetical protein|uniref:hypothetical protein n=1 Tax=Pseudonocardia thermophila TaxID=1848 RepID=UPI00248EF226|nr:hypothetical protein [Pseudonocardia thermophila]